MRRDGMAPAAPERLTAMLRAGARGLFVEEAAVEGLERGELACSGSELSVLKIAASLAAGCPVSLRLVLGGFDHVNITLVAGAVLHANGTVGGVVIVPAPPAYPAGVRVVAADGTVLQEGGAGAR